MKFLQVILASILATMPCVASAQTGTSQKAIPSGIEVTIGGKVRNTNVRWVYLSKKDCLDDTPITFEVTTSFSMVPMFVELWQGPYMTDCTSAGARTPSQNGSTCTNVVVPTNTNTKPKISTTTRALFGDKDGSCKDSEKRDVFVTAFNKSTPLTGTAAPDNTVIKSWKINFWVDLTPPTEPTEVTGTNGESEVTVDWTDPADETVNPDAGYHVYYGTQKLGINDACESTELVAGKAAPTSLKYLTSEVEGKSWSPSAFGLTDVNTKVAVAVTTRDGAGNESVLSEITCVGKVNTIGFDDACQKDPKCKDAFDSCALAPGRRSAAASAVFMLACAGILLRRRRRNV